MEQHGLGTKEAKELLSKYGKNEIVYKRHLKALKLFVSQFPNFINGILISAIHEGRTIYQNILRSITYLLSSNLSELSLIFFAILFGLPNPLLPTQILWINLVTDGLPAMALASDNKVVGVLQQKSRDPKEPILTLPRISLISIIGFGLSGALLVVFYSLLLNNYSETFSRTVVFNLLIFSHMGIAFLVRGKSIFRINKFLIFAVLLTILLQIVITTTPSFQKIFHLGFSGV